jgi:HAD superfamily hydrolase (TIGR01549 family)
MALRAVLFDLFGTVVHFAPQVPTVEVAGTARRSTMGWLRETAARELPEVRFDDLLPTLMQVTEELVRQRPPEYLEVPSRERFRRALLRVGVDGERAPAIAERLSLAHMAHLASTTRLPVGHGEVLQALAARYRLGLVSNFDHGPTARRVLAKHGVTRCFEVVMISDVFGRRKPHPAIFDAALRHMGVPAEEAVFVGDSVGDDVIGATNAQLDVVWINAKGDALPPGAPTPRHVIRRLDELPALLGA